MLDLDISLTTKKLNKITLTSVNIVKMVIDVIVALRCLTGEH